jgi:hypothetical protein
MVFSRIYWQRSQLTHLNLNPPRPVQVRVNQNPQYFIIRNPISRRTIMMSDHLNATGLSAEESRKLKSRSEREDEKTIIRCLKEVSDPQPKYPQSVHRAT